MIYDVEWLEPARQELGAIWRAAGAAERQMIERLIARVNDRRTIAPYTQGESRSADDVRLLFELPLRVEYRIERFQGALVVLHVRLVRKRSR
jgi:hypothetical protein